MNPKILGLPALLLGLVACESVDSTTVTTAGLYANITATADGSGSTRTTAILKVGGATSNTYVDLIEPDSLEATQGEETQTMSKVSVGDYREYVADFEVDAVDTEFAIAFLREVDEGAPNSVVQLPAPFELTEPSADTPFSRDEDDIVVSWDVIDDSPMRADITGDCFFADGIDVDVDDGTARFSAASLESYEDMADETCDAVITVWRTRAGDVDPNYGEGGAVSGVQVRSVTVVSGP